MLDRIFLVHSRLPLSEFVQWVAASRYELTPFEEKLFELVERMAPAHVDDEETDAETLKQIIDLGVIADSFGYCEKKDFEHAEAIEWHAARFFSEFKCGDSVAAIEKATDIVRATAGSYTDSDDEGYRRELGELADQLEEISATLSRLRNVLNK